MRKITATGTPPNKHQALQVFSVYCKDLEFTALLISGNATPALGHKPDVHHHYPRLRHLPSTPPASLPSQKRILHSASFLRLLTSKFESPARGEDACLGSTIKGREASVLAFKYEGKTQKRAHFSDTHGYSKSSTQQESTKLKDTQNTSNFYHCHWVGNLESLQVKSEIGAQREGKEGPKRQAAPNGQVAGKSTRKLTDQRRLVWFSQIYGTDTSVTHHPLKPES